MLFPTSSLYRSPVFTKGGQTHDLRGWERDLQKSWENDLERLNEACKQIPEIGSLVISLMTPEPTSAHMNLDAVTDSLEVVTALSNVRIEKLGALAAKAA